MNRGFAESTLLDIPPIMGLNTCNGALTMKANEADINLERVNRAYERLDTTEKILPSVIYIEPTSYCNINCIMCPNSKITQKSYMPFALFRRVVDEIKDVAKVIKLNYRGEPLLHSDIIDLILYCKDSSTAKVCLATNATFLTSKMSESIIESGLDEITFSIDGDSPGTYMRIRRGANFQQVCENITNFLKMVKGRGSPRVVMKFIQMNLNKHEVEPFIERWRNQGCEISISWLSTWAGQLTKLTSMSNYLSPKRGLGRNPCAELWYKMIISCSGIVPICCYDFLGKHVLGNVRVESIEDIWNSEKVNFARRMHYEKNYHNLRLCSKCNEWSDKQDVAGYFSTSEIHPSGRP